MSHRLEMVVERRRVLDRQIRPTLSLKADRRSSPRARPVHRDHAAKKSFVAICTPTVSQTDTGGRDEESKVIERTLVKELGNLAP